MPMIKTFTENDLTRFLYGELNTKQTEEIKQALSADPDLQDRFNELREVLIDLDKVSSSPSDKTIERILSFSRNYPIQPA